MTAIRSLAKQPRFTIVAAFTLALGIGAVTAIFSVVNGVLLKPLPFPDADRLVNIWSHAPKLGYPQFPLSPDLYFAFERENQIFEKMALFQARRANLTGDGAPEVVDSILTTYTYFDTLGVTMLRGRSYSAQEDSPGGPRVVVLSHRVWQSRFGGRDDAVGRVVRIDGEPAEVVGVAPAALDSRGSPDFHLPFRLNRETPLQGSFGFNAIGRLAPGTRPEDVSVHLGAIVTRYMKTINSPTYRAFLTDGGYELRARLMKEDLVGDLKRPLWILLGTSSLLLLVACANVANLFLVRAEGRQTEMAVRVALGAGRGVLVRQLLKEALLLSAFGSALGVATAAIGMPMLLRAAPPSIPRLDLVTLDWRVLAFAAGTALLSALVFGLAPAFRYARARSLVALGHGGRGETGDRGRRRARNVLVVVQTAMALVLLVGAGLLSRSFTRLMATDPGFTPAGVMTFRVALPTTDYRDGAGVRAFVTALTQRLSELPGVESAGSATVLPIANSSPGTAHQFEDRPLAPGQLPPMVHYKVVGPGYFTTMRIPIVRGRDYHSGDFTEDAQTLIVNQAVADLYWPDQDPVGKRVRLAAGGAPQAPPWFTVVGVVGNERQDGLREPVRPLMYYAPAAGVAGGLPRVFDFVVRGDGLEGRSGQLRDAVWSIDRGLPVAAMRTMQDIVDRSIVQFTFTMLTLGLASALALVLGAVGLYGVLAYAVSLRTREIGVRLALGAPPLRVMRAVVANGLQLAGLGLLIGLAAAAGVTRYLGDLLYETKPLDLPTFGVTAGALLAVALAASYLPARRAASVSPLESMK